MQSSMRQPPGAHCPEEKITVDVVKTKGSSEKQGQKVKCAKRGKGEAEARGGAYKPPASHGSLVAILASSMR